MGCSGSKGSGGESLERLTLQKGGKLTLWGDHFNSETRAILSILEIANVPYEFVEVNTLEDKHKEDNYKRINPSGTIPFIENGNDKVIGGGITNIQYLIGVSHKVSESLYPEKDQAQINTVLNWFYSVMRTETQRLIKLVVPGKVQGGILPTQSASQLQSNKEQ